MFITTPRGENHATRMYKAGVDDPEWFADLQRADKTGVFSQEDLESERRELIREWGDDVGEALFRQEYLCDFNAPVLGVYYAKELSAAEDEGRITNVPYEPIQQVHVAWDLGIGDSTALVFAQLVAREWRIIDYYEASGVGLDHYVQVLRSKPYTYGSMLLPHDAEARELGTGKSRVEVLASLGLRDVRVLKQQRIEDGINAVRMTLPKCWFDRRKCEKLIEALRNYRTEYDDKRKVFKASPLHDWSSHAADAFRYLVQGMERAQPQALPRLNYPSYGIA
jgi:hypothetical protein